MLLDSVSRLIKKKKEKKCTLTHDNNETYKNWFY